MRIVKGFTLREIMGVTAIIGEGVDQVNFNKMITLNKTAAFLWHSVEHQEFDMQTLVDLLVDKYDVDVETACRDVKAIVKSWHEVGLIEL